MTTWDIIFKVTLTKGLKRMRRFVQAEMWEWFSGSWASKEKGMLRELEHRVMAENDGGKALKAILRQDYWGLESRSKVPMCLDRQNNLCSPLPQIMNHGLRKNKHIVAMPTLKPKARTNNSLIDLSSLSSCYPFWQISLKELFKSHFLLNPLWSDFVSTLHQNNSHPGHPGPCHLHYPIQWCMLSAHCPWPIRGLAHSWLLSLSCSLYLSDQSFSVFCWFLYFSPTPKCHNVSELHPESLLWLNLLPKFSNLVIWL